jgi:hypothetical protein
MTDESREDRPGGGVLRVFLNYRNADTGGHALHLYTDLAARFGDESIFMDMRALENPQPSPFGKRAKVSESKT